LRQAFAATRRGGRTVTIGLTHPERTLTIPALTITAEERVLMGSYMGSCVPSRDIPRFIAMYRAGLLPVDFLRSSIIALDKSTLRSILLDRGEVARQSFAFEGDRSKMKCSFPLALFALLPVQITIGFAGSERGMVSTVHPLATKAGVEAMRRGGERSGCDCCRGSHAERSGWPQFRTWWRLLPCHPPGEWRSGDDRWTRDSTHCSDTRYVCPGR
jgi:hypothetical protein